MTDNLPPDPVLQRAALRAASAPGIRPFLTEALVGAMSACGAPSGVATLSMGGYPEEFLVTFPPGEPAPRQVLSLFNGARHGEAIGESGAILRGVESPEGFAGEVLAIPLTARGERVGWLLLLASEGDGPFEAEDLERCQALATTLAPLVTNALKIQVLEEMVVRDDTADCYNRRYLEEFLEQETARSRRFGAPLSLIFLDIDDLKSINSEYGHGMGSRALRECAREVSASIRRIDKLFRYGGDEFCIVLPETDLDGAREVAERVRRAISSHAFLRREVGKDVRLTVSLGIANFPLHASVPEEMIAAADAAMRSIKRAGKNAVMIAPAGDEGALSRGGVR